MRRDAEVAIVGAGPAGARAAELLARKGVDVLLLDPKVPWEKPCGGGLTAPLFDELPELAEVRSLAQCVTAARIELGPEAGIEVPLGKPIWIVSRAALARWQLERATTAGAAHEPARVSAIERAGDVWRLHTATGTLLVGALVGADGAASTVRRASAPSLAIELVPTRVSYPRRDAPDPSAVVLRFYGDMAGYLWDFPRPDHRSVGIEAIGGSWRRPELDARIDAYRETTEPGLAEPPPRVGAVIGTSRVGHGDFSGIAGRGFALLGDAAGLADPMTGEGIRNAFRSAELLAKAWAMGADWARTYPALARSSFARELALSRLLRRTLSESGVGVRLVGRALSSDLSYAVAAATLHTLNVHEPMRFFGQLREALHDVRAHPHRRGAARHIRDPEKLPAASWTSSN